MLGKKTDQFKVREAICRELLSGEYTQITGDFTDLESGRCVMGVILEVLDLPFDPDSYPEAAKRLGMPEEGVWSMVHDNNHHGVTFPQFAERIKQGEYDHV